MSFSRAGPVPSAVGCYSACVLGPCAEKSGTAEAEHLIFGWELCTPPPNPQPYLCLISPGFDSSGFLGMPLFYPSVL